MILDFDIFDFVLVSVIIILLPLVTDLVNNLFPNAKIGRIATEIVGFLLVFFIITLIFVAVYLWYSLYLPYYLVKDIHLDILNEIPQDSIKDTIIIWSHIIFTIILVINIYYYYYQSITSSSTLPIIKKSSSSEQNDTSTQLCSRCNSKKLSHSYHCRICKRCIHSMDHHCPFIANCVGKGNHPYFYLFLCFIFIGMLYASYLSYFPFKDCYLSLKVNGGLEDEPSEVCKRISKYSLIFICSFIILIPATAIMTWQTYVLYTSNTTVHLLRSLKNSPTYTKWIKSLYSNIFTHNQRFTSYFPNFKLYNLIIPYSLPLKTKIKK